jgi:hypothetical protein
MLHQTPPFIFFRSPRLIKCDDSSLSPAERAWKFFGLRTLMAVAMARHPSVLLLVASVAKAAQAAGYQAGRRDASVLPSTRATLPRIAESSSSSSSSRPKPLSTMSKAELEAEARDCGLDARGATAAQLKMSLKSIRDENKPAKGSIKGLSTMEKEELQQIAKERHVDGWETMTVAEMRRRLQGWSPEAAVATGRLANPLGHISGTDVVTFGRLKGLTYSEVLKQQGKYASWVVREYEQNPRSSPGLKRLGRYLAVNGIQAPMEE